MSTHRTSYYHFSKPMATRISVANEAVVTANTALSNAYDYWHQNINIATPVIEDYYKGMHSPELYDAYWYHPDHLGSSSYITNLSGRVTQHNLSRHYSGMEYLPFGETLVDEHLNSHNSPFKFNAKEFDAETGNYYYGARYYDPKESVWLSVDPLFEKYPNLSPYIYTANNPVIYIDPDGRQIEGINKKSAQSFHEDINKVFSDKKFDDFRSLITRGKKNNKRTFDKIDETSFNEATSNLEGDDKLLAEILYYAINSDKLFIVEYLKDRDSSFSNTGKEVFAGELNRQFNFEGDKDELKVSNLIALGGSGYSVPTTTGSYSFIVSDSYHLEGERALTSFHEVLGHGVPHSKHVKGNLNQDNAIRLENLTRRVMGIETMRNGTNPIHSGGHEVPNHKGPPMKN